jgi:hypothetical protein
VPPFGTTVDPVEAGRRGGRASGIARRLKPLRELEAGIAESRNGAAKMKLHEVKRRQLAELERAQLEADRTVMWLMDQADAERATIARLRERRRQYELAVGERIEALEQREQDLRRTVDTGEGLVDLLRVAHERGWLEGALVELDVFEVIE